MSNHRRKRSRRGSQSNSGYQKLSKKVFKATGMPLSSLLASIFGILVITGIIFYVVYGEKESLTSSAETPTAQFDTGESEEKDYLAAVTVPPGFAKTTYPERIEKVDWMIDRCDHLLSQESNYKVKIEDKILSLLALKAVMIARNNVNPAQVFEALETKAAHISASSAQPEEHLYLLVVTYMSVLSIAPDSEFYDKTIAAIDKIKETTPIPPSKAIASYNSAIKYFVNCKDKAAAGKLIRLLGKKLSLSKTQRLSDLGLSLLDYPNFSSYYVEGFKEPKSSTKIESSTEQLLKQIQETPPHSLRTYDLLLNVPEQYLKSGNKRGAVQVLEHLRVATATNNSRIQDNIAAKIEKQMTRINLLGSEFALTGVDISGVEIKPTGKETTIVIFWNPHVKGSGKKLDQLHESRLYDTWSSSFFLVPMEKIEEKDVKNLSTNYPKFRIVHGTTSEEWIKKSGVISAPYLLTLDQTGTVRRMSGH